MELDPDLPDELSGSDAFSLDEGKPSEQEARQQRLQALGVLLAQKRDDAIKARTESGIESIWTACEEAYLGIDDVNRHEFPNNRWNKPTTPSGPLTSGNARPSNKATAFVPLTARYVDMGRAKVCEQILPIDDKAFTIDPPSSMAADTDAPAVAPAAPAVPAAAMPGAPAAPGAVPAAVPAAPAAPAADPQAAQGEAVLLKAKKAEDWIYDRMKAARYPKQMRRVMHDASRIGTGVLKGPFPDEVTASSFSVDDTGVGKLEIITNIVPSAKRIDAWNLFPAAGCGEDIHDGDHIWERDHLSAHRLKALKALRDADGAPIYLPDAIDKVLDEGPGKSKQAQTNPNDSAQRVLGRFEVWTMHGVLTKQDLIDCGAPGLDDLPDDAVDAFAIVTIVNDTVIRATVHPLKSGKFPYRVIPWSSRAGHWAGIGVGERVSFPQKLINAGLRAIINNAGKSSGIHVVLDRRAIAPADGSWDMNVGDKVWTFTGEGMIDDIRKVFYQFQIENLTAQMMPLVELAEKLAEEATSISLITQGHTGKFDPDTFGQAELQDDNAHTLLRDIAYEVDDTITEPLVTDFYEWYLLDPEVPDADKGLFQVNARGSSAMVEKVIQESTFPAMASAALNPAYGQNPKKLFAAYMRSKRLNPDETAYSPQELAQMQASPPPVAPVVQAAQIKAATAVHIKDMDGQQALQQLSAEAQRDHDALIAGGTTPHEAMAMARIRDSQIRADTARYVEDSRASAENARAQKELDIANSDGNYRLRELEMQRDILLLEYSNRHDLKLIDVKAQLANTAMQIQAKHELNATGQAFDASENRADRVVDLHKHHTTLEAEAQQPAAPQAEPAPQGEPA